MYFVYVMFFTVESFPSCFGADVTNLNEPPTSFLLPPHYCGLGAGFIPFRAIVNYKQCEMRGLFMSLNRRCTQPPQGVSIPQNVTFDYLTDISLLTKL